MCRSTLGGFGAAACARSGPWSGAVQRRSAITCGPARRTRIGALGVRPGKARGAPRSFKLHRQHCSAWVQVATRQPADPARHLHRVNIRGSGEGAAQGARSWCGYRRHGQAGACELATRARSGNAGVRRGEPWLPAEPFQLHLQHRGARLRSAAQRRPLGGAGGEGLRRGRLRGRGWRRRREPWHGSGGRDLAGKKGAAGQLPEPSCWTADRFCHVPCVEVRAPVAGHRVTRLIGGQEHDHLKPLQLPPGCRIKDSTGPRMGWRPFGGQ
mmetsp:Transcript_93289/g.216860  ORF Transcript_93289/g.216860 Transcript_93289/m.216860 type:complete len:269 (-) Transcript_93289:177-983(-)